MGIKDDKPVIKTRSYKVGGDNVRQLFPQDSTKPKPKMPKLESQAKLLRYHYKLIKEAYETLAKLQQGVGIAEDTYDEMLKDYAERVGLENVEKRYLDYGSKVKPVTTEYGIALELTE